MALGLRLEDGYVVKRGRIAQVAATLPRPVSRTGGQVAIVVAFGLAVWAFLAVAAERHGFFDLKVYYGAINFWVHDGGQLYDYLLPKTGYGFTYPPFGAVVMSPMSLVGWPVAIAISVAISVCGMAAVLVWLLQPVIDRHGLSRWFTIAIALELAAAFEPMRETVNFGQVNVALLTLVAADILVLVRRGHRLSGIGIGLAAAIKITPGVFIVYLLVTRRWKAAAVATGTAAAATWLAATIAPDASRVYWTDAFWHTERVGSTAFVSNQSLNGIVSRFNPQSPSSSMYLAAALLALVVWIVRLRRAAAKRDEVAALALTGVFSCLVSPITWVHHLVWALPALVLMVDHSFDPRRSAGSRRRLLVITVATYAILCSRAVWAFEFQFTGWGVLGSNVYALILVGLLVGLPLREYPGPESGRLGRRSPAAEDVPDLVDLDRQVTAAFKAKDAGRPAGAQRPVGARSLVDSRQGR